jgi:hypothetical protein
MRAYFLLVLFFIPFASFSQTIRQTLDRIYVGIDQVKTLSYDMSSHERIDGKMIVKSMSFRINASPRKVYMKDRETGVELLYVSGWNNNNAYINPNGFPWVNVSLGIQNSKVRADGHHCLLHAGFTYAHQLLKGTEKMILDRGYKLEERIKFGGDFTWNNINCFKLILDDPLFGFEQVTISQDQTLYSYCEKNNFSEYMIMVKNDLGYGAKLYKGQKLTVPTSFAKKVELYVDKSTYLPVLQYVYDNEGLFEKYEFKNVRVNPKMDTEEWTTKCKLYKF